MTELQEHHFSIVVPVYNEAGGLQTFHQSLLDALQKIPHSSFEVIYSDDGSTDKTVELVTQWAKDDQRIKLVALSRNFGKEYALAAGIAQARADAIITLDGDGQHPIELVPDFIKAWEAGAKVVVGLRISNQGEGAFKRLGSRSFYALFNHFTEHRLEPGATDFRLIDKAVQRAFLQLRETDRINRGLIDWLGFDRTTIPFKANARLVGTAGYSRRKLIGLATNSFISLTPAPLYLFGCLGVFITVSSLILGLSVIIEQLVLADPWHWKFTGTAMLGILLLFLVGIVLMSQGILSLYISHVQKQSKQRPLYIIDYQKSHGISQADEPS